MSELRRAEQFLATLHERTSEEIVEWRGGAAFLNPTIPKVWDVNMLRLDDHDLPVGEIATETERVLAAAGCDHRRVWVPDAGRGAELVEEFTELGWDTDVHVIMAHHRPLDRKVDTGEVVEVGDRTWSSRDEQLREIPEIDDDVAKQMRELYDLLVEAGRGRDFAIVEDGRVVSFALLFSDGVTGQIEDVATLAEYRGRGLSRQIVTKVLDISIAEHDFTFLVADDRDWPKDFYSKLGFDEIGHHYFFLRRPDE